MKHTITYDGIEWTLSRFIDAYGFRPVQRYDWDHPLKDMDEPVMALTYDGQLIESQPARQLPWSDITHLRIPDDSMRLAYCPECNDEIVPVTHVTAGNGKFEIIIDVCELCS